MWKIYRYHGWLEGRSLWLFALVGAGINLVTIAIVLAIAWQIFPHWIPDRSLKPPCGRYS